MAEDFGGLATKRRKGAWCNGGALRCAYRRDGGVDGGGEVSCLFVAKGLGSSIPVTEGEPRVHRASRRKTKATAGCCVLAGAVANRLAELLCVLCVPALAIFALKRVCWIGFDDLVYRRKRVKGGRSFGGLYRAGTRSEGRPRRTEIILVLTLWRSVPPLADSVTQFRGRSF